MKVCLYDHHNYVIPTDGIGGVIGLFQILCNELKKYDVELTIIVNDMSTLQDEKNLKVVKLPFSEIENIRYGRTPVIKYFDGDIFYSNSSGRHVNFNFQNFNGKWVSTCHGCQEWVGGSQCQIFVSNNQLLQHLRDGYFDSFSNNYKVIHVSVDTEKLYPTDGQHDRIVWMGRIDGAKAERLYNIAKNSKEKILMAGWYEKEWEWLFQKILSTNNVEWVGEIKGDVAKREFYGMAKLSIHCSTFEDPCPTSIIESQSCGVPVITYANGSMNEICYYKNLIFSNFDNFIFHLNSFEKSNDFNRYELHNYVKNFFSAEKYGLKYFETFKEMIHYEN